MAGRIRDSDIALVRERSRIDDVIGEYVSLRRAGGGALKGLCPFHDEKSPSFNVRPSHGTFHCFGCAEGGDVIAFLMKIEHIGFVESVERLADKIGLQLTYEGGRPGAQRDRGTRTRMIEAHRAAAAFYAEQVETPEAEKAREYLAERGFDRAMWQKFGCGYAPSGWDKLTKHLLNRGFELDELYKAQLSKEGRQGAIDRFHRRLVWPLRDLGGEIVGFGARRIFEDDNSPAKYLNTAESPIYKKSQVLFGIDLAKREIAKRRQAVVVEGYTDVMAMQAAGVPTAVASCGTAFGDDHMTVLRRLMIDDEVTWGEVIFTFDGDAAGQKAALKAFEGDQQFVAQTYIAIAPDGMDPCELRQAKGDAAVRDLVARRKPLIEFAIQSQLADYDLDSIDGQIAALQKTVPLVARIKDRAKRDAYAAKLAWWVGWADESMVVRRVRESAGGPAEAIQTRGKTRRPADPNQAALIAEPQGPPRPDPRDVRTRSQREVLKLALQAPALAGPVYDSLPEDTFTVPAYAQLHHAILAAGGTGTGLSGAMLVDAVSQHCPEGTVRSLLSELAVERIPTRGELEVGYVSSMLAKLQCEQVARQIAEIKSRLQRMNPISDADEYRSAFGDLVAFEEYHRGLIKQAAGAYE